MDSIEEINDLAIKLAKEAGSMISACFFTDKKLDIKSCETDLVTETDKNVEKHIFDGIRHVFPSHISIGEETTAESNGNIVLTDDPTWIVDPIDGTTNFVHQFPYVAVCIGVVINKNTQVAVVYNPIKNELFTAVKGKGACLNGKRINVSNVKDLKKSMILTEFGSSRDPKRIDIIFNNLRSVLTTPVHAIHSVGSAALNMCLVAQGSAEAYYETGIHCWDYCASSLIVEEAGGVAIDTAGGKLDLFRRRVLSANNMQIAIPLSKLLQQMELPRD